MSDFNKSITDMIAAVNKVVGKNKMILIANGFERQECVPFGIPSLDANLQGGIPLGHMLELFGPEGGGKTTLGLHMCGGQARKAHIVVPVDAEHKLDPKLALKLGTDFEKTPYCQPRTAEEAFSIMSTAADHMSSGDIFLVDSAPALVPEAELEKGIEHQSMGGNSKVIAQGINFIRDKVSQKGIVVIFINQLREKIGSFVPMETTPCGRSLKHACSVRLEVRKTGFIKDDKDLVIGQDVRVKVIKAAHCAPYTEIPLKLFFGKGFSKEYSLFDLAVTQGIIIQTGAWFIMGETKYHGKEDLINYIYTPEGYKDILSKVKI